MNMFKGLLFLHGHFTRPEDLDETPVVGRTEYGAHTAADDFVKPLGNRAASAARFGRNAGQRDPTSAAANAAREIQPARKTQRSPSPQRQAGFLDHLLYLGGRPMHAGHNFDVEDPFEQIAGDSAGAELERRAASAGASVIPQSQPCAG